MRKSDDRPGCGAGKRDMDRTAMSGLLDAMSILQAFQRPFADAAVRFMRIDVLRSMQTCQGTWENRQSAVQRMHK